jgi:hypothetical protein
MTRATAHADSDERKVIGAKRTLARILKQRRGKGQAISSKALADRVGLKATTVRDLIPEIRREQDLPVVSTSTGYYLVASDQEFREVMKRIEDTIATKRERQSDIAEAYYGN